MGAADVRTSVSKRRWADPGHGAGGAPRSWATTWSQAQSRTATISGSPGATSS